MPTSGGNPHISTIFWGKQKYLYAKWVGVNKNPFEMKRENLAITFLDLNESIIKALKG